MALSDSHFGSRWLLLALSATLWHTLALSGSLLLSNFAYTVLDRLSGPLLGSQRRCNADALSPAMMMCSTLYVRKHETATSIQTLHVSARSIVRQDFIAIRQQRITEMRILLIYYTMFCITYKQYETYIVRKHSLQNKFLLTI